MPNMLPQAIAALRSKASGSPMPADDFGVTNGTLAGNEPFVAVIAPDDTNSIAFSRSPAQVISVATLANTTGAGGFYPNGLNGVINGALLQSCDALHVAAVST